MKKNIKLIEHKLKEGFCRILYEPLISITHCKLKEGFCRIFYEPLTCVEFLGMDNGHAGTCTVCVVCILIETPT
jgi:hypothetical protein